MSNISIHKLPQAEVDRLNSLFDQGHTFQGLKRWLVEQGYSADWSAKLADQYISYRYECALGAPESYA